MPRPAIPKPGFSLLRLHNSRNPHLIKNLNHQAKTNLINSIAQDIEGCIWAINHYTNEHVLDDENTFEFHQIIDDIHRDERLQMERLLEKMMRKVKHYKREARAAKRGLKRLRAGRSENRNGVHHQGNTIEATTTSSVPDCLSGDNASEQDSDRLGAGVEQELSNDHRTPTQETPESEATLMSDSTQNPDGSSPSPSVMEFDAENRLITFDDITDV